jgi:hypothetical protein
MKLTEERRAQEFLMSIYLKAWSDDSFKKSLINSPIETLNKFTSKTANLPKDKMVLVEDQTNPNFIYINIPANPNIEDLELDEEQLDTIHGGKKVWFDGLSDYSAFKIYDVGI